MPLSSNPSGRSIGRLLQRLAQLRPRLWPSPASLALDHGAGAGRLPSYVALGCWRPGRVSLDARLELLVGQLSAELSACRWCIEQGRHQWRKALLPAALLRQLRSYRTSGLFSERECAALALAGAVARYTEGAPGPADQALVQARLHFTEAELIRIAHVAAGEHFFDPATGAVGMDVRELADPRAMPWDAIRAGIGVRGWR